MPVSPRSMHDIPTDFRAPPPSPVASGRRSSVTNDDVLTEFLQQSLHVPDLVLPDKIFPRQKFSETPQKVDFQLLCSRESDVVAEILDSLARIGCFQLINHGISREVIELAKAAAARIFKIPTEKKAAMVKKSEKPYGFEEAHVEEESELSEEFVWCRDEGFKSEMEGIWPAGYSNFSENMEALMSAVEKVAEKILQVLWEKSLGNSGHGKVEMLQSDQDFGGSVCWVNKHSYNIHLEKWENYLRHDVIRMLIKGIDYSHALCLHLCDGSSEFHVYSKKGWLSFCPDKDAIVITVGDQVQTLSGGQYKHVIGRPIFKVGEEDCISMGFLYSSASNSKSSRPKGEKTISLSQQAIAAVILTLVYQFLVYVYKHI